MSRGQFDKKVERQLLQVIEKLVRRFSLKDVKHAAAKFLNEQRIRAAVEKERKRLEQRLKELEAKR